MTVNYESNRYPAVFSDNVTGLLGVYESVNEILDKIENNRKSPVNSIIEKGAGPHQVKTCEQP